MRAPAACEANTRPDGHSIDAIRSSVQQVISPRSRWLMTRSLLAPCPRVSRLRSQDLRIIGLGLSRQQASPITRRITSPQSPRHPGRKLPSKRNETPPLPEMLWRALMYRPCPLLGESPRASRESRSRILYYRPTVSPKPIRATSARTLEPFSVSTLPRRI